MDEYYLVFRINLFPNKGKELSHLMDIRTNEQLIRGFRTKRKMREFVDEFSEGMIDYIMLKPVS